MGYTKICLQWLVDTHKLGLFEGLQSVLELGAQVIHPNIQRKEFVEYIRLVNSNISDSTALSIRSFYLAMGFTTYNSIDTDGQHGSFSFDLNKIIAEEYSFTKTFDLVTNLGTTEHIFNQSACFENVHNLTSVNGLMIHGLPIYGWINHGFYQLSPIIFEDLAFENEYQILKRQLIVRENGVNIETIIDIDYDLAIKPSTFQQFAKPGVTMLYICILKKQINQKFKIPFQGMYRKTNLVQGYKN